MTSCYVVILLLAALFSIQGMPSTRDNGDNGNGNNGDRNDGDTIPFDDEEELIDVIKMKDGTKVVEKVPQKDKAWHKFYHTPTGKKVTENHGQGDEAFRMRRSSTCSGKWTNGHVPYRFSTDKPVYHDIKGSVKLATDRWAELTCLTFEDISDHESKWNQEHIVIADVYDEGCTSLIGMYCNTHGQAMNLEYWCDNVPLIMHEFAHAIGMYHQHAWPNRDQYVTVVEENVEDEEKYNFVKEEGLMTYGSKYDYTSLLHYGKTTFSIEKGIPTILTKDPLKQFLIGSPPQPSHYDLKYIHKMYGCAAHCTNPPSCQNDGFVGKDCTCVCPHHTSGEFCQTVNGDYYPAMYDSCGPQLIESDTVIKSFNYPDAHQTARCVWYFKAPEGKKATITFDEFNLLEWKGCKVDYVDFMYDLYTRTDRHCSDTLEGVTKEGPNDSFMIMWRTGYKGGDTGFKATVKFVDKV